MGNRKHLTINVDLNKQYSEFFNEHRCCPSCNHDRIQIRKVKNHGQNQRQCYPSNVAFWRHLCGKCQTSWDWTPHYEQKVF